MSPGSAYRLRISGRVQGVGFRQSLRASALGAGLRGWVRNRADGTVEAHVEGAAAAARALIDWAHHGPAGAQVTRVRVEACPPEAAPLAGFEIRPTR